MIRLGLLLIFLTYACALASWQDELKNSPAGARIAGYYTAFNSGDEAVMKTFLTENFADSVLKIRPVEERLKVFRQMKQNIGQWKAQKVMNSDAGKVTMLAQNASDEWFELNFLHESNPPFKLMGLMLMPAEDAPAGEPITQKAAMDSIQQWLASKTPDEFSGVVLVAHDGESIFTKAYGWANRDYQIPNKTNSIFNLGSITKTFTQLAIQKLVSENKLSLSDKLGKLLPEYPNQEAKEKITVQQLLDHAGGISDFFGEEFINTPRDKIRSLKDYLPFFENKALLFEPGTQNRYSNGGYILLGLIIEKLSGKSYADYLAENIYKPAGMIHSGSYYSDEIIEGRATGYTHRWNYEPEDSKELRSNTLMLPGIGSSAGGTYSTAEDLLKFTNALELGKFSWAPRGYLGIAGGAPGLNGAIESGVGNGCTIIVLCNLDPPTAEDAAMKFRRWLSQVKK